jgi:hypothetical protein
MDVRMSTHPVDVLLEIGVRLSTEQERELREVCDAPVELRWSRTTRDAMSHLFAIDGGRSIQSKCGKWVPAASLVVERFNNARCTTCAMGGTR